MRVLGIYTSPRKDGNSDILMKELLRGAAAQGAETAELFARKLKLGPCIGCDRCIELGHCFQDDDYSKVATELDRADAIAFATPVHFYTVSTQAMILIGRVQEQWNQKYVNKKPEYAERPRRPGALVAVGATKGKTLFDGLRMTVKYYFDAINVDLAHEMCVRSVDHKGEIRTHPELLQQAFDLGALLARGENK